MILNKKDNKKDDININLNLNPWNLLDVFFVIFFEMLIFLLIKPVIEFLVPADPLYFSYFAFVTYLLQTIVTVFVLYFFAIYRYKINIKKLGFNKIPFWKTFKYVLGLWILTTILITLMDQTLLNLFGSSVEGFKSQEDHIQLFGDNIFGYVSLTVSAFIIAPVVEEALFRGFILSTIMKFISPLSSILITSILFAILHFEFSSVIPLFMIGCILGWIYYKTKSIWACLLFHAINNGVALIMEFLFKTYL